MLLAHHSLHFRVHTRVLLTLVIALAATAALWAEPPHRTLLREAADAQKAGDATLAVAKLEAARAARPDYPRVRFALAGLYTAAGRTTEALAELTALADMGLAANLDRQPALAPLRELPAYTALTARFAANAQPAGTAATVATLPAQDGIIESVAIDAQGRAFFGDVRNRCIWVRSPAGEVTRFSQPQDGLLGVFGLAIDEQRGVLWAGVSAVPEMLGYTATDRGWGYLAEYDLRTGAYRRSLQVPTAGGTHIFGSLRLAADGSVFVSDSASPVIWRATPEATQLEAWLEHDGFVSLQGLDFSADGRILYVADYANGLWAVDVATRQPALLAPAAGTTLFGIDDLHCTGDALLAVQNGIAPARIVRLALTDGGPLRAEVRLQGAQQLTDVANGTVHAGRFTFVSPSGWSLYEQPSATPPASRDVVLHALAL